MTPVFAGAIWLIWGNLLHKKMAENWPASPLWPLSDQADSSICVFHPK
jgi:hypothetical protein